MMAGDMLSLREFYAVSRGQMARRLIGLRLLALWPKRAAWQGVRLLGYGYALPYLHDLWPAADVTAFMPSHMGSPPRADEKKNMLARVEDMRLPLADNSIDHIFLIHALEIAPDAATLMQEIWRVLVPGGRVLLCVPNRRGLWARSEASPWGSGRPFSKPQIRSLLHDSGFVPLRWTASLALPPFLFRPRPAFMKKMILFFEKILSYLMPGLCGLILVEATKLVYAPIGRQKARHFRLMPTRPVMVPELGRILPDGRAFSDSRSFSNSRRTDCQDDVADGTAASVFPAKT